MSTRGHLLIIDDEIGVLNSLKRTFRKDYEVHISERPKDAFIIMEKFNIGVILCDQRMPEMTGTEFLIKIKDLYPDTTRILITGYSELNDVITSVNEGQIFRYITKPWNLFDLTSSVKEAFDKYGLIRKNSSLIEALKKTIQNLKVEIRGRKEIEGKVLRLASIVESTEEGIIGITLDGIIIDWNRGAESIYGYPKSEIIGESIIKLTPEDKHYEIEEMLANISQGISITHHDTIRQRKDGQLINVYYTVSPIRDHARKIIGASKIVTDVTAEKKIEEEMTRLDRLNLVAQMAAGIGHEIRNPMTTVRGYLQLLGEKPKYAAQKETFDLMISELDRANAIITEFLSLAQTKRTEQKIQNLNDLLCKLYPLIEADTFTQNKQVSFIPGEIPNLKLNENQITQLLLNLTRNGLEAMEERGCLKIKSYVDDAKVVLSIADEGCGIPPENLRKLGTPFFTTKDIGTGLGLATCYKIAEFHNAKIDIDSSLRGTTFSILFLIPESSSKIVNIKSTLD